MNKVGNILEILVRKGYLSDNFKIESILSGTTQSLVLRIVDEGRELIIKVYDSADSESCNKTFLFLNNYSNLDLFPKLKFCVPEQNIISYIYYEGETYRRLLDEYEYEDLVINMVKKYDKIISKTWGESGYEKSTFINYVLDSAKLEYNLCENFLPGDYKIIAEDFYTSFSKLKLDSYLIHGDLGLHNIVFDSSDKVSKVIDPQPVIGIPVMDALFLFLSSEHIENFKKDNLLALASQFKDINEEQILSLFMLVLYIKIGKSIRYNRKELENYLHIFAVLKSDFKFT